MYVCLNKRLDCGLQHRETTEIWSVVVKWVVFVIAYSFGGRQRGKWRVNPPPPPKLYRHSVVLQYYKISWTEKKKMRADTLGRQVGGGWALEIKSFLGPVKWYRADRRVPFGAQKLEITLPPFTAPLQCGKVTLSHRSSHPTLPIQNLLEIKGICKMQKGTLRYIKI